MSEPIQSIAQNNYILQAPPPTATMFTTELEYDGDKISGYAGSAFKAGDEFPVSADEAIQYVQTNSATIDDTVTSYQTNSGTYLTAHQSLEGYVTESGFEYNGNDLITAYNGSAFAGQGGGGASYTAGDNIDITNNVISVDDVSNLSAGDGISITQDSLYTTITWLNDAGIKNVVYTASLPATPDNNTLYLIPET